MAEITQAWAAVQFLFAKSDTALSRTNFNTIFMTYTSVQERNRVILSLLVNGLLSHPHRTAALPAGQRFRTPWRAVASARTAPPGSPPSPG